MGGRRIERAAGGPDELTAVRVPVVGLLGHSAGDDTHRRVELARSLSDWHLIAFLGTTGLFSEVRRKILRAACDSDDTTIICRMI